MKNGQAIPEHRKRALLFAAAVVFAAAAIVYSASWMYYVRWQATVELGIDTDETSSGQLIRAVYKHSPAERAGLRPGDEIVAVNGQRLDAQHGGSAFRVAWLKGRPGDTVSLLVQRPGEAAPFLVQPVFRAVTAHAPNQPIAQSVARQILGSFPVLFLVVGLAVLFLRVEDRNAWLLAAIFAGIITVSDVPNAFGGLPPGLQNFLLAYRSALTTMLPPLFFAFFAVFPARSPIDRKAPWLKWLLVGLAAVLGLGSVQTGESRPLPLVTAIFGRSAAHFARLVFAYGTIVLGLLALMWNAFVVSREERRKINVLVWGTVVAFVPVLSAKVAEDMLGFHPPFWLDFFDVILLFLFPVSFAYAVVKHRVLGISVLIKRSARYLLVERGFVFLMIVLAVFATLLVSQTFSRQFAAGPQVAIFVGAFLGVILISVATRVHRKIRRRLDRAFFRSAYDAQQLLEQLAAQALAVDSREALGGLLDRQIREALKPQTLFVYLESDKGHLRAQAGLPPPELATLLATDKALAALNNGAGFEVSPESISAAGLSLLSPEWLVPIPGIRDGHLQGLMVLGPRLSEEPYSAGDKRLLTTVASQAGIAMRSLSLADEMSQRIDADRRVAQEMQIARQVQSKLLPQEIPLLPTLACAGRCIQTRAVGGDYYDFLELGGGNLALLLADISGKGISAALLMANLQANLRSQYVLALDDIPRLLRSVNRLFFKNTETQHYATLFFAVYDDQRQTLQYVNCGHNPPLLLRSNGLVERLDASATVLGLFEAWDCSLAETNLSAGDVLVIYTDGITEAADEREEEFGDERLIAAAQQHQSSSAEDILNGIFASVQGFSRGEQRDDMTLVVAKCKACGPR